MAADKGYHANATLELAADLGLRTYIPEPQQANDACGRTSRRSSNGR